MFVTNSSVFSFVFGFDVTRQMYARVTCESTLALARVRIALLRVS